METKKQQKADTQHDRARQVLADLKPDVTAADRKCAAKHFGVHELTVHRYLNGDVRRLEFAVDLIRLFRARIAEREKQMVA